MKTKVELDNSNISKHLGQSSAYAAEYDPTLLVREPRQSNRTHLDISDDNLPFVGTDTWNGYEVTGLTYNGLPAVGICKFVYPCTSKYIVESKSVKLYFNSFSMTKLGTTSSEVLREIEARASKDLSALVEAEVRVFIYSNREAVELDYELAGEVWNLKTSNSLAWNTYFTLENTFVSVKDEFDTYTETPELLQVLDSRGDLPPNDMFNSADMQTFQYHSALLRSRCRVTSQPDTGDVFISYVGAKTVTPLSLLKYIVSFRDECHFHEEICEAIYKRLWDFLSPQSLSVKCLYARRGSWDINPERVSDEKLKHKQLSDAEFLHSKLPRQ